ncbi:hypothetical protein [Dickeya dianthicola]|uniref:hypothetical protein n=1 Tax=Dickeya dianthicola TaxID=204039 RepID=UPI001868B9CD|nr:hypothetical protein [Dickeya dianthicola]QOL16077.1 hypothetical protein HGI48_18830 [Dickeya dianthicola]
MSNNFINSHNINFANYRHSVIASSIGIYCTVSSSEFRLALNTLSIAACSEYISYIIILITDKNELDREFLSLYSFENFNDKLHIACGDYGSGYEIPLSEGGYDQVSARNDALEIIYNKNVSWVMQHDADDIYDTNFYEKICKNYDSYEAVMTECYTLNSLSSHIVTPKSIKYIYGKYLISPHIRVWKKNLKLKFKKSKLALRLHPNETRHCGVEFPNEMKLILIKKHSHYHLHRLLNKRHSGFLDTGETHTIILENYIKEKVHMLIQ